MNDDIEKWYRFCMICPHSYKRKDDADTVYCRLRKSQCIHKKEIDDAERKEE